MSKLKLPLIIVAVLAALVAGLFFSGILGGGGEKGPVKKHVIEPVSLAGDFTVNLADGEDRFAALNIALELEPMDEEHWATYSGANAGGHGGGGEAPGPIAVATYPKFADAVVSVTSTFKAETLLQPEGKAELKRALLTKFAEIAEKDAEAYKAGVHTEGHVSPPFHVQDVYFTKYIIK